METQTMITLKFGSINAPYEFKMFRKSEVFGSVPVDQFWFHLAALKAEKGDKPSTFRTFCDVYHEICLLDVHAPPAARAQQAETYVMARLVASTRSRGRQSVFLDASESPELHKRMHRDEDLEIMLRNADLEPITERQFHDRLADMQLITTFDNETQSVYRAINRDLFKGVTELFLERPEEAVRAVQDRWSKWMDSVSRGNGQLEKKVALDVHSHEATAAFRRCYSAVWSALLLPKLFQRYALSGHSYLFHEYWHQQIVRITRDGGSFHPFHGHCLGLHPAAGRFIKTRKGKELIGDWLADAVPMRPLNQKEREFWIENLPMLHAYGRLLSGYLLAFQHYAGCRDHANSDRRKY